MCLHPKLPKGSRKSIEKLVRLSALDPVKLPKGSRKHKKLSIDKAVSPILETPKRE